MGNHNIKWGSMICPIRIVIILSLTITIQQHGAAGTGLDLKGGYSALNSHLNTNQDQSAIRPPGEGAVGSYRPWRSGRAKRGITWAGTKWCGPGDSADHPEDLGSEWEADTCCRQHDACPEKIKAFRYRYHRWNWRTYTVSLCDCDVRFYNCLLDANTTTATSIFRYFFDLLDVPCFHLVEEIACIDRAWYGVCREQGLDLVAYMDTVEPSDRIEINKPSDVNSTEPSWVNITDEPSSENITETAAGNSTVL